MKTDPNPDVAEGARTGRRPQHVGLIMDGNRRWARAAGFVNASIGHKIGANHLGDLLDWLHARGIDHASVYVLSADNIRKRDSAEIAYLCELIRTVVPQRVRDAQWWRLHIAGDLDLLPATCADALRDAQAATADRSGHLTLAIGYDPKQELTEAVRRILRTTAVNRFPEGDHLSAAITEALPGGPVKDIDLVIRTSGEQRISGFFPWQSQHAEIHVSDKMWPAFTEHDLDMALIDYESRIEQRDPERPR